MKVRTFCLSGAALLFALGAAAQPVSREKAGHIDPAPGSKSEAVATAKDKLGHAVGVISAEMTTTTKGFVSAAAATDIYEVEAAKLALNRTKSNKVRQLAEAMITAHTRTTKELKTIVAEEKLDVILPDKLDVRHQTMIDDLRGVKLVDFDERYVGQQIDTHNEALILMRGYHSSGDNVALKKFAGNVENAVKKHLGMAERLNKSIEAMEEKSEKH